MDSNHRSPARKSRFLLRKANCGTERGQPKRVVSYAVPMVRIHLPPAESPLRTSFSGGKRGKVRGDDKGDGQHALDLRGMRRCFEGNVVEERVDGRQTKVPRSRRHVANLLLFIEEIN